MYVTVESNDLIVASTEVAFPDKIERLMIVADEVNQVHVFLWATVPVVDGHSAPGFPTRWGLHWRGSLQSCLQGFGEVHGDLVVEQGTVRQLIGSDLGAPVER